MTIFFREGGEEGDFYNLSFVYFIGFRLDYA